jgi:hypothetical protein
VRCKPEARELVETRGSCDNKSVAETGTRHLVHRGSEALTRSWHEADEAREAAHHRDRRAAERADKGVPSDEAVGIFVD